MSTDVDLRPLAIDRGQREPAVPRPRHVATRYVLPAAIVAGFAGLVAWAARESFLPRVPVTVVPVVVVQGEVWSAGQALFQAAGWIEPRPTPIVVSSLVEGVIEKLLVVEGQDVRSGEEVARLIDTDARLALKQAEADLDLKRAELAGARAELAAARLRLEQPVHLEAALAEAGSLLAQAEKELARLPFEIAAAQARRDVAQQDLEGKRAAGASIATRLLEKAQGELTAAEAARSELRQRQPHLERMVAALAQRRDALQRQLALRVDEAKQHADAQAVAATIDATFRAGAVATATRNKGVFQTSTLADLADLVVFARWLGYACLGLVLSLVATTTVMAVQDRVRQHAVLQTIGVRPGRLFQLIVSESLLVCVLGGLIGTASALAALGWGGFGVGAEGVAVSFAPSLRLGMTGLAASLLVGVVAGIVPAWLAARVNIVEALRQGA